MPDPAATRRNLLATLLVIAAIGAWLLAPLSFTACGKSGGTHWIAAWNTSWTGPESAKPVSRDGRYAYFTTMKFINPDRGEWAHSWKSPVFRGRVDLVTGRIETGPVPGGYQFFTSSGIMISDTIAVALWADSIFHATFNNRGTRFTGYGDGHYSFFIGSPISDNYPLVAYLLDNQDTYRVIGPGFRDGWISTDEKSVVLLKADSGDTWIYDIEMRKLHKLASTETAPRFIRGIQDLSEDIQRRASEAMGRHCAQRRYSYYPEEEELR